MRFIYVFDPCDCRMCLAGRGWGLCLTQPRPVRARYIAHPEDDEAVKQIGRQHAGMDVCPGRSLTKAELLEHAPSVAQAQAIHQAQEAEFARGW